MAAPQIFNRSMKRLAYLENAMAAGYQLETNALWTASFKLPADDVKNEFCQPLNFLEIYDGNERVDLFRIIGEDLTRSDSATRVYDCEHVLATLLNDVLFQYHQYGGSGITTSDVINYVLNKQTTKNWKLKRCDFSRRFEYNWENSNLLAALFAIPECFDADYLWAWDTTVYPWELSLIAPTDALSSEIRYRKNMTSITKAVDATNISNRVYALGYGEGVNQLTIEGVNGGVPYVEDTESIGKYGLCPTIIVDGRYEIAENLKSYASRMLSELKDPYISYQIGAIDLYRLTGDKMSKFRPGGIVRIVDEEDNINLRTRIVTVEKPDTEGDPGSVTVTLANKEKDIAGSISDLQNRALINETYAQGATNQQIYNFADNADPEHPAVLKIFVSGSTVRINKMSLNIEFEAFRAFEKTVKSGGGQTTSSGGGSTATSSSGGGANTSTKSGGGSTVTSQSGGGSTESTVNTGTYNTNDVTPTGSATLLDSGKIALSMDAHHHQMFHSHRVSIPSHRHSVTVPSHTHDFSVPAHSHTVNIPEHTHNVEAHTHDIEFGIYEGETATAATIIVDGTELPAISDYDDINIIDYLATDGSGKITRNTWHTIKVKPNKMSRIVGAVFAQTFCASRGGGDY